MKTIVFTHPAAKDLDALPPAARRSVERALVEYAIEGSGDTKRLQDRQGFRLRVGDYRVIFDEDQQTILAIYIGRRSTTTYRRH